MYSKDKIKLLSVNGIEPTYDNIKTGLYNIQTAYYAVIRKDEPENSNARKCSLLYFITRRICKHFI